MAETEAEILDEDEDESISQDKILSVQDLLETLDASLKKRIKEIKEISNPEVFVYNDERLGKTISLSSGQRTINQLKKIAEKSWDRFTNTNNKGRSYFD